MIRALAPATALALLLSACGDSDAVEESSSSETEESQGTSSTEEEAEVPSFADPGILTAECGDGGDAGVVVNLFSAEDGSELHTAHFSTDGIDHAESEDLSHGRAANPGTSVSLAGPCSDGSRAYLPERGMLVGTFEEEVNGNRVSGFGVLTEDRTFTALSPEQELSDFDSPTNYLHPVGDSEGDRIVFVEDDGENTPIVQALDLESGEITDLGTCESARCGYLTVLPGLDGAVLSAPSYHDQVPVLGGSALLGGRNTDTVFFFGMKEQTEDTLIDLADVVDSGDVFSVGRPQVKVENGGRFQAVGDNTLLFDDNVLSVWEFTEDTFLDYEEENADVLPYRRDPVPAERTLVPEGPRTNSDPHVSPDGTEVIFRSKPQTGDSSWYRVPLDGSGEPEEFPGLPLQTVIAWQ